MKNNTRTMYVRHDDGEEISFEYNKDNRVGYAKHLSDGSYEFYEYDDKGRDIHYKTNGFERWKKFDEEGNRIWYKDSDGIEEHWEYDDEYRVIHYRNSNGEEEWTEWDEFDNIVYYRHSNGKEENKGE